MKTKLRWTFCQKPERTRVPEVCGDQYPYGYTGDCSEECEIPLAVLKEFYAGEDTEEGENQELYHIAMVAARGPMTKRVRA